MSTPRNKGKVLPVNQPVTAFVLMVAFDLEFNFVSSSWDRMSIVPDTPKWESETCFVIPFAQYRYVRVSKKNPELSRRNPVDRALNKVKLFALQEKNGGTVLKAIKGTGATHS